MEQGETGPFRRMMAVVCHHCPVCRYGRDNPESFLGRLLHHRFHAEHCPFWKAEKEAYSERHS